MTYSQKYCLIHFVQPIQAGSEFSMDDWPVHITLADVFAVDLGSGVESKLKDFLVSQRPVVTMVIGETVLGSTPVVLLDKTSPLFKLHEDIVDLLQANGAVFNTPEFTRAGFLPHSTIQKTGRLHIGENVTVDSVALVDMFPGGDWRKRRVLGVMKLAS